MLTKAAQGLLLLIAIAVVARVVIGLLGPLVPMLVALLVVAGLIAHITGGPRPGGGLFHK